MAADMEVTLTTVLYYAKEGYYRHMQSALSDLLTRFGSEPILLFWKAFSMILEDRVIEGIREARDIQESPDLIIAIPLLLIHAHRQCSTIDKEAIHELETSIKANRRTCSDTALYYASIVYWLAGRNDKAKEYLEKSLKSSPTPKSFSLMGWINLTSGKDEYAKKAIKYFDESFKYKPVPLLAVLGKARYHFNNYQYIQAIEVINAALVPMSTCIPLCIEKMKIELALNEWDVVIETAKRCLSIDPNCIEATQMMALEQCIRNGNMNEVASLLGTLIEQLDRSEPQSHHLYIKISSAFARLSGKHSLVLQQTQSMADRALSLAPSSTPYTIERAYQYLLAGNTQSAINYYKKSLTLSDTNMSALMGMIHCKLIINKTTEAQQQLEFINELQGSSKSAELLYYNALAGYQRGSMTQDDVVELISSATKTLFSSVKGYPLGLEYFIHLNPVFVMSMGELLMLYAPNEPPSIIGKSSKLLQEVMTTVGPLVHAAPGLLHVQLLLAQVQYLSGNSESALSLTQMCIDGEHCVVAALVLQAIIHLQKKNYKQCSAVLESALSTDFEVQHYPLYLLVKGQQEYLSDKVNESIETLRNAIKLKKPVKQSVGSSPGNELLSAPTVSQWVGGHLTLCQALSKIGQQAEANQLMTDCVSQYTGSAEEARVTIAHAELLLERGDVKGSLELLQNITADKLYFIQAKERMAEIYLKHVRNKERYIECYRDIADKLPGPPTAHLLGDALISIHEPEQAIAVFEKALKKTPSDAVLTSKVGNAYIKMHNFNKAVSYYEASLKNIDNSVLKCELAQLYTKLQKFDQAERILLQSLVNKQNDDVENNLELLRDNVSYCRILVKVYLKTKRYHEAIETLEKTRKYQTIIVKKVIVNEPDSLANEKETLANILHQLAKEVINVDNQMSPKAEIFYKEAVENCPNTALYRESLAEWYLSVGQIDECEQECVTLLQMDPNNDTATVLLAELLFVKGDIIVSIKHFEELLIRIPTHFKALARYIELLRRGGVIHKADSFIELAELQTTHPDYEAGLKYCKGLISWYKGDNEEALKHFNYTRHDSEWGEKALFNMIEICLSTSEIIGCESLKGSDIDASGDKKRLEYQLIAARTAEKLLREIRPKSNASILKVKVLENYILLIGQSRQNAETVIAKFNDLPQNKRENIPCLVVMAMAYLVVKQVPRARNLLKRIGKTPWVAQYSDELEKGWILLSDVYIQSGKYDLAIEQLKKCLKYNQSCSKAYEYLGFIAEKEQAYQDAAAHYSNAWIHSHMTNPVVGYRLAFNYLKGQSYLDAIDTCHELIKKFPNYPRVKSDILDKARQHIRM